MDQLGDEGNESCVGMGEGTYVQLSSWLTVMPTHKRSSASHCSTEKLRRSTSFIRTAITSTWQPKRAVKIPHKL